MVVLLVIVQIAIKMLRVVLLVEELVVMVGNLHKRFKEMVEGEQPLLDLVVVEEEGPHLMIQTQ